MPITWRNVAAPSFSDSNALLNQATQRTNDGLQGLTDMMNQSGERMEKQYAQETDALNERYKAQIAAARSSEEVAALQEQFGNGYFDSTYGSRVKGSEMLGALDQRGQFIRQDTMEEQEFQDTNTLRGVRNLKAEAEAYALRTGDIEGAQRMLAEAEVEQWAVGDAASAIAGIGRENRGEAREDARLAISQANANREAEIHRRTIEGLDKAKNTDQRRSVMQDAALNYAGEFGDTEEGYQAFLAEINSIEGLTADEKLAASEIWTKGVAAYNDVPVDVQRTMDDTYDQVYRGYQQENGIDFTSVERQLKADAYRFESESVAPYIAAYSEAGNNLTREQTREIIASTIDHSIFDGEGATVSKVVSEVESKASELANSILSDPNTSPAMREILSKFGGRIPESLVNRAVNKTKISRRGNFTESEFESHLKNELNTMVSTISAYDAYVQKNDDVTRQKQLAQRQAQEAADAIHGGYRLRTYNASRANQ